MTEQSPDPKPDDDLEEEDSRPNPFGWPALIIIAILIVGGWFLITSLNADGNMQDCIQSGRRNCAPVDTAGK